MGSRRGGSRRYRRKKWARSKKGRLAGLERVRESSMTPADNQYRPRFVRHLPTRHADILTLQSSIASSQPFISTYSWNGRSHSKNTVSPLETNGKPKSTYAFTDNEFCSRSSCYRILGTEPSCQFGRWSRWIRASIRRREIVSTSNNTGSIQLDASAVLAIQGFAFTFTLAIPTHSSKFCDAATCLEFG
jgi:hypothetical protein